MLLTYNQNIFSKTFNCYFISKVNSTCKYVLNYHGSSYHSGQRPIKMAFSSYESTNSHNNTFLLGIPIIIMHGLFGSKSNWNSLSKAIHNKSKKKIITVDARNHGDSPHTEEFTYHHLAADICFLMKELNLTKASLLGHSMGGRAMMTFALKYPELVESLIVVDISPVNSSSSMLNMNMYFEALKSVELQNSLTMSQARKSANDQLTRWIPDPAVRQFLLTNLTQIDGGHFKWRINLNSLAKQFQGEIMNFPIVTSVCKAPTLFIGGTKSDYLKLEDHRTIKSLFPEVEFHYLDTGHWVHSEKPTEFIDIVSNFLSKHNL